MQAADALPVSRRYLCHLTVCGWLAGSIGCVSIPDVDQARGRAQMAADAGGGVDAPNAKPDVGANADVTSPNDSAGGDATSPDAVGSATTATRTFTSSTQNFANPERGFAIEINRLDDMAKDRGQGGSLVYVEELLDIYRGKPLDSAYLDRLDALFDLIRQRGMKAVLRFVYNRFNGDDAPKANVLQHIGQLKPVLAKNVDVLYVLEAGFIGARGGWYGSTNNLLVPATRAEIYAALLDMVPQGRSFVVPYVDERRGVVTEALDADNAFGPRPTARTGLYDSCLLNDMTDAGFYTAGDVDTARAYTKNIARYTPFGVGIAQCTSVLRFTCPNILNELRDQQVSWVQIEGATMTQLDALVSMGCQPTMQRQLGYRFGLSSLTYTKRVAPGGVLDVDLRLTNEGWSILHNPRPVFAVLDDGQKRYVSARLSADPRAWTPSTPVTMKTKLRLPAGQPPGAYKLALWLPDDALSLRNTPAFSVRFANDDVWDAAQGYNVIATDIEVAAGVPGDVDTTAMTFIEIR